MDTAGGVRALVVDDNAHARAICQMRLRALGVDRVEDAKTGAEALLMLMGPPFSLMLLDWYMPDITGAGVMEVLRDPRFGAAAATPVILMTAYSSRDNLARAHSLGVNYVLAKPFSTEELGAALTRVLPPTLAARDVAFL